MDQGIGYVPLIRFSDSSGEEVRTALDRLSSQGARSFILDLRCLDNEAAFVSQLEKL